MHRMDSSDSSDLASGGHHKDCHVVLGSVIRARTFSVLVRRRVPWATFGQTTAGSLKVGSLVGSAVRTIRIGPGPHSGPYEFRLAGSASVAGSMSS